MLTGLNDYKQITLKMEDNRSDSYADDQYDNRTKTYDSRGYALQHEEDSSHELIKEKRLGAQNKSLNVRANDKQTNDITRKMRKEIDAAMKTQPKPVSATQQNVPKNKKPLSSALKPKLVAKADTSVPETILDNCFKMYETNKNLKKKVEQLKDHIHVQTAENELKQLESERKQWGHETLLEENNYLKDKVKALERQVLELKHAHSDISIQGLNEIHLKAENECLRQDMRKLLGMLKGTAEYSDFANMFGREHNIRYLSSASHNRGKSGSKRESSKHKIDNSANLNAGVYKNLLGVYLDEYKLKSSNDVLDFTVGSGATKDDRTRWVPEECYDFMKGLQRQAQLSDSMIEYILHELNRRWQERERDIIKFYKKHGKANRQVISSMSLPSDEKDKVIAQLRKEVLDLQARVRTLRQNPKESTKLEKTKEAERLEKELKEFQHRSSLCRQLKSKAGMLERVNQYLTQAFSQDSLAKYYQVEGATDYNKKIEGIMQNVKKDVMELLEKNLESTHDNQRSFQDSETMHMLKVG